MLNVALVLLGHDADEANADCVGDDETVFEMFPQDGEPLRGSPLDEDEIARIREQLPQLLGLPTTTQEVKMPDRKTSPHTFASEYLERCKSGYYVPKTPQPVAPKTFQAIPCPDDLPAEIVEAVAKLNADWKAAWVQKMRQYDAEWAVWSDQAKALEAEQQVDRIAWLRWVHEFRDEDFRQPLFHAIQRESVAMEVAGFATTDHTLDYLVRAFYTGWVRARLKPVLAVDKSPYDG